MVTSKEIRVEGMKELLEENKIRWMSKYGAEDITIGLKEKHGELTDQLCFKFWVHKKHTPTSREKTEYIPEELIEEYTDVVEEEEYSIQGVGYYKMRPILQGASIGCRDHTGTGGFLYDKNDGKLYELSNSHALAIDCFKSLSEQPDTKIYQPGPHHRPPSQDTLCGHLRYMLQLNDWAETNTPNNKECALAELIVDAKPGQIGLKGPLKSSCKLLPGDEIIYSTWQMDGITEGIVTDVGKSSLVNHPDGRQVMFVDQIVATKMSGGGSSGSGVMRKIDMAAGGLNHAGSLTRNIICSIQHIDSGYGGHVVCVSEMEDKSWWRGLLDVILNILKGIISFLENIGYAGKR